MADPKGLSARMSSNIVAILPKIAATIAERTSTGPTKIDLSTAENWLLRPELLTLCKDAISRNLTADVRNPLKISYGRIKELFPPPPWVVNADPHFLQDFSYPLGFGGDPALLDALASFFNSYFHPSIPVLPRQIATTAGASSCLDSLLYNICDPGDTVLVPGPYWSS